MLSPKDRCSHQTWFTAVTILVSLLVAMLAGNLFVSIIGVSGSNDITAKLLASEKAIQMIGVQLSVLQDHVAQQQQAAFDSPLQKSGCIFSRIWVPSFDKSSMMAYIFATALWILFIAMITGGMETFVQWIQKVSQWSVNSLVGLKRTTFFDIRLCLEHALIHRKLVVTDMAEEHRALDNGLPFSPGTLCCADLYMAKRLADAYANDNWNLSRKWGDTTIYLTRDHRMLLARVVVLLHAKLSSRNDLGSVATTVNRANKAILQELNSGEVELVRALANDHKNVVNNNSNPNPILSDNNQNKKGRPVKSNSSSDAF
jgi:hypothetical protein